VKERLLFDWVNCEPGYIAIRYKKGSILIEAYLADSWLARRYLASVSASIAEYPILV
jgi:hypothetical protein